MLVLFVCCADWQVLERAWQAESRLATAMSNERRFPRYHRLKADKSSAAKDSGVKRSDFRRAASLISQIRGTDDGVDRLLVC